MAEQPQYFAAFLGDSDFPLGMVCGEDEARDYQEEIDRTLGDSSGSAWKVRVVSPGYAQRHRDSLLSWNTRRRWHTSVRVPKKQTVA
ncbi:MAG: hypothetical protein KKF56_01645 [Nanoarchaeota archaeon]|nr:hypothetical protein [Nanoarchaeota archaeon]